MREGVGGEVKVYVKKRSGNFSQFALLKQSADAFSQTNQVPAKPDTTGRLGRELSFERLAKDSTLFSNSVGSTSIITRF
jgi:hypothetical protein